MNKKLSKRSNLHKDPLLNSIFPLSLRSQVTIFVVLAIVIFAVILVFIFLFPKEGYLGNKFSDNIEVNAKYNEIRQQIINCEKFISQDALDLIGVQGGYYEVPKESYDISFIKIPYFYYEDGKKYLIPSNTDVEKQLGLFIDENINFCLDNIDKQDFLVTYKNPKTIVKISEDSVNFKTDLAVSIKRDLSVSITNLKDFSVDVNSRIFDMLDFSRQLLKNHDINQDLLCITCVSKLSDEKGFFVEVRRFNLDEQSTLIAVNQNNTDAHPFIFEFLEKYKTRTEVEF